MRRRFPRVLSGLAFLVLALAAELVGRALTARIDLGRHVAPPRYADASYYPLLVAAAKVGIALLLARLLWRLARAHALERAARRVLGADGTPLPRLHVSLSPRLWLASFASTASVYLVQTDILHGGVLAPWVHSSALPVFAALSVFVALLWGVVAGWLADYEQYAEAQLEAARCSSAPAAASPLPTAVAPANGPRRLFGQAFESRPPPVPA